jgi:hypothetical protein
VQGLNLQLNDYKTNLFTMTHCLTLKFSFVQFSPRNSVILEVDGNFKMDFGKAYAKVGKENKQFTSLKVQKRSS